MYEGDLSERTTDDDHTHSDRPELNALVVGTNDVVIAGRLLTTPRLTQTHIVYIFGNLVKRHLHTSDLNSTRETVKNQHRVRHVVFYIIIRVIGFYPINSNKINYPMSDPNTKTPYCIVRAIILQSNFMDQINILFEKLHGTSHIRVILTVFLTNI